MISLGAGGGGKPDEPFPVAYVERVIDGDTVEMAQLGRVSQSRIGLSF
jgi:hypothetical protein